MLPRFAALAVLAVVPAVASAQRIDWVGEKVMLRDDGIRLGKVVVGELIRVGQPLNANHWYTVKSAGGGLLELADGCGWVARADAVRWRDAEGFFTAKIQAEANVGKWYVRRGVARDVQLVGSFDAAGIRHAATIDRNQAARQDLVEAVRLDPNNAYWRWALGLLLASLGEFEAAAREYDTAARLAPNDDWIFTSRAIHLMPYDWETAMASAERAIALAPSKAANYAVRGVLFSYKQRFDRARAEFDAALKLDPDCAGALSHRGVLRALAGEFEQGLADVNRAIELVPDSPVFVHHRIQLCQLTLDYRQEERDMRRLVELAPTDPEAHRMLAYRLATCPDNTLRDGKLAVQLARKALELAGGKETPAVHAALAAAYAECGEFDKAVEAAEAAVKRQEAEKPGDAGYLLELKFRLEQYRDKKPYRR